MAETRIEKADDLGEGSKGTASLWSQEITSARKYMRKFREGAIRINRRYLDQRDANQEGEFRVNLFWSNVQVVMSMLYAQPPSADVKRLYDDFNDEASRVGSEILERILNNDVQADGSTSNAAIRYAIQDWITIGMGTVWSRYSVDTEMTTYDAVSDPVTGIEMSPAGEYERITNEDALTEYVYWDDFLYSPARIWEEVRWVARRVYMTKEQLVARFGEEVANQIPLAKQTSKATDAKGQMPTLPEDPWQRAEVWEIWDKRTKTVYWYNTQVDFMLDQREDPLQLENFFPCPPALMANLSTTNLMPRSDFIMAQDQFEQLDEINTRITWLTRAMKVVGVYDKSAEGVQRMLGQAVENQLIPVDNWAMFAESGGLKSKVDWLPIQDVAAVVERLVGLREQVKGQIYEVLGISDIMRGNTKASETASAQQIKAQFGSTRMQLKQFYVAQFVQQALAIKAEIIERHFQPETIAKRSNIMMTPDAQYAQAAIELIKNPEESKYRVTVEADSIAYIDRKAENDSRTAALTAMGQFAQQISGLVQQIPGSAPYMLQILQWYGAGFKGYQAIEGIMDQAIEQAKQQLAQPKQPDPMHMAEIQEKQAGAIERKATAVQKLADAELKTMQAMGTFPAPPEQFINGMGGPVPGQQPPGAPGGPAAQPPMGGAAPVAQPRQPMMPPSASPAPQGPQFAQPQAGLPPAIPQGLPPGVQQ